MIALKPIEANDGELSQKYWLCSPERHVDCPKLNCQRECFHTTHEEFAMPNTLPTTPLLPQPTEKVFTPRLSWRRRLLYLSLDIALSIIGGLLVVMAVILLATGALWLLRELFIPLLRR